MKEQESKGGKRVTQSKWDRVQHRPGAKHTPACVCGDASSGSDIDEALVACEILGAVPTLVDGRGACDALVVGVRNPCARRALAVGSAGAHSGRVLSVWACSAAFCGCVRAIYTSVAGVCARVCGSFRGHIHICANQACGLKRGRTELKGLRKMCVRRAYCRWPLLLRLDSS